MGDLTSSGARSESAIELVRLGDHWSGRFTAMASPCDILVDSPDEAVARQCTLLAAREAWRIEHKYSRYRTDNWMARINQSKGAPVVVDEESARLLDFAARCHQLSGGLFDITSGALRAAWPFDGRQATPDQATIDACLARVGWQHVHWQSPTLTLRPGMALDFGGIGKEYAVDRVAEQLLAFADVSVLVNFGGDMRVCKPRRDQQAWRVGIEHPKHLDTADLMVEFRKGGMATSGDTRRFIEVDGKRYGHILDPRTGWPVEQAPRSVTVLAGTCTDAGLLATLAMLQGANAETFLESQQVLHWIYR